MIMITNDQGRGKGEGKGEGKICVEGLTVYYNVTSPKDLSRLQE